MTTEELTALVISYAQNKQELDSYKKICTTQNEEIKGALKESGAESFNAGAYVAKYIVQHRETLDEDVLLAIIKKYRDDYAPGVLSSIVRTREYVDMDGLENAIYTHMIPEEIVAEMKKAYSSKDVETLKIVRRKEKK